ncbi:MAG: (d)CMP kinase [Longibaculum muris]|uniref:Cytidylate kinase n=1 Tax=Longibaculum muris TaxID=1796628 RepID=A0A4R3YKT8_9FIRM|nr:(d)CMP kinase [Longibaculum muris]KXU51901.1 cytidylate kinase [Candidatus Stoquefichus sp. KLE1796]MBS5369984.1 (d)CMP kinase [Coprobacillus cateniformis]MCR1889059.1 (d)CMP kinase [Longibaculum muris]MED9811485.1 (d)CMP kinase [Longibaculum muris]TCV93137.1 cytidylate kinase [Longibaculum muris]
MKKISIAIDGPAAAGKSTIAKMVAKKLNYTYIDTGAMYRCVAYATLKQGLAFEDEKAVSDLLKNMQIEMKPEGTIYLNGEDVTSSIRQNEVSMGASIVSKYQAVREFLVEKQREMAQGGGVILDGRDIGTVVLKDAELKIYQIASIECRALRRHKENLERGMASDLEAIKKEIAMRDEQDMNRQISPLKKADDAIEIDTSEMSLEEVVSRVMELVESKI